MGQLDSGGEEQLSSVVEENGEDDDPHIWLNASKVQFILSPRKRKRKYNFQADPKGWCPPPFMVSSLYFSLLVFIFGIFYHFKTEKLGKIYHKL